ncbi:MAG: hypothetical protein WBB02_09525 [Saprospiraceae bacterium]
MKKGILYLLILVAFSSNAQPVKLWSKIFGGNVSDIANVMGVYNDTMLIAAGRSSSTNVGGNKGGDDFIVCQFKPTGDLIRLKTFGGPQSDQVNSFVTLPTGNVILGGFTNGKGSDVSNLYGLTDIWILAYNPVNGSKVWEKSIGGTNNDLLNDLFYLEAGRIFIAGHTKSIDRDLLNSPTKGGNDILVSSIDEAGAIVKTATFGGTKDETAKKILRAESFGGQMLIFGETESNDLDFNGMSKGKKDIFILKINRNINKVFLTTIGGPGDDLFGDAVYLGDSGMIIFGTVNTVGGQVDSLKGAKDLWMVKLDKAGNLQWKKNIGGRNDETSVKAQLDANNDIILLANSSSRDQDMIANYGGSDVVVMKLDTSGNIKWQKNYGGTSGENAGAMCFGNDGSIYFAAQSFSVNTDLPATNTVPPDFWTVKLFECTTKESFYDQKACFGDTIVIHNKKYYSGKETGIDTLKNATINGCDSIVHISTVFFQPVLEQIDDTLCNEATITINNIIFDKNNPIHTFKFKSQFGCDSFLLVDLSFSPALEVIDTLITKDDGTQNGCIEVVVDGGCKPYQYIWTTGDTTSQVCSLATGNYKLVIIDCKACSKEFSFKVGTTVKTEISEEVEPKVSYTTDHILIGFDNQEIINMKLYTLGGQLLLNQNPLTNDIIISRKSLPKGIIVLDFVFKNGKNLQMKLTN